MEDSKKTGSYYTPPELVDFMISYLKKEKSNFIKILEPSVGDGRFLLSLASFAGMIDGIELIKEKADRVKKILGDRNNIDIYHKDFLDYAFECNKKYSVIIGNPPYIRLKTMEKKSIETAKKLCNFQGIGESTMKNIWVAFVAGACKLLEENGTIFFVLPIDFLQVQYAEKLRIYLEKKFNTIHVICFKEAIFKDIEQEVCLVYLTNRKNMIPSISYKLYEATTDRMPAFQNEIKKNKPLRKWTNAILTDQEIELLKEKSDKYIQIDKIGNIAPGVVTGGNDYFILTQEKVEELKCEEFVLPILEKPAFLPDNTIVIDDVIVNAIRNEGKPIFLLNLAKEKRELPKELIEYLDKVGDKKVGAMNLELKKHFKCANRTPWFGVPIGKQGAIVFYRRYHIYPRVFINSVFIHTTDAGYNMQLNEGYDAESLVFCFYNSITLAQCEYNGRYYGGGVSEMVPSEFKCLRIPYRKIDKADIELFQRMFHDRESIDKIIEFVNTRTICQDMERSEILRIEKIRLKLKNRRIRNKSNLKETKHPR